jgi:putative transposase
VKVMCHCLGLSSSGYYSWRGRPQSHRAQANEELLDEIRAIHQAGRGTYGSPKVHQILRKRGKHCSRKRVARIMRLNGIVAKRQRIFKRTTRQHASRPVAANHLSQQFTTTQPNQVWLADITYIRTKEGWLYLAAVIDLFSRQIIGWSMSKRMMDDLTLTALQMAVRKRLRSSLDPASKLMHHSDRGSQYTSKDYQRLLTQYGIQVSMSSTGNCYDNAPMESFFALLKTELVHHERYATRQEARTSVFDYIEVFYNRQRVHSAIDYQTPAEYESCWCKSAEKVEISNEPHGVRYAATTLNYVSTKPGQ